MSAPRLECRSCGESPMLDGIVSVRGGKLDESSPLCRSCIEAQSDDDGGLAVDAAPERPSPDEFVKAMDPALAAWLDSQPPDLWASRDMRMAGVYGELAALYELSRLSEESDSIASVFETYLAGRTALRRHRDSLDFARSLARHMADPKGADDTGGTDAREN